MNAGHVEAGQLFYVIIEDEKNKAQALQKMQEDLNNLMMKEEGQLLNNVVVNYAGIGQPLKFEAKEKQLLKVAIEDFVDDNQLLKGVNLEGNQNKESWLIFNAEKENDEDCAGLMGEVPREIEDLWYELSLLENRLENQRVSIHTVQLELSGNEEAVIDDKSKKKAVKNIKFPRKRSRVVVLETLQVEIERDEALMSHSEELMLRLQYGEDEQKIVLWDSEENGVVEYALKLE